MKPNGVVISRLQKKMYMHYVLEIAKTRLIQYGRSVLEEMEKKEKARRRRPWVRNWVQRRAMMGGECLIRELRNEDPKSYRNILRMNSHQFEDLLERIQDSIQRKDTNMRNAIPARTKLEVTLRFLATGDSFMSLSYFFRMPPSTISTFLPEVLRAICEALSSYLQVPDIESQWQKIALQFNQRWNFPDTCGAIDGKHVHIKQPPGSGSNFYNYKGFFSVVLFAMADANYNFVYINVGANGRVNDAGIFRESALYSALEHNTLNMPRNHVILGDSAFPLKNYLMKPYTNRRKTTKQHIFNYRLSRARRVVENAFGILASRFRVFTRPIELKVDTVDSVIIAACTLHNWLRATSPGYITSQTVDWEDPSTGTIIPGSWRREVRELESVTLRGSNNYSKAAENRRLDYTKYFWSAAPIPQQWKAVGVNEEDVLGDENEDEMDDSEGDQEFYVSGDDNESDGDCI